MTASLRVLPDHEAWLQEAGTLFAAAAQSAIGERGSFVVALAGGTTPKDLYEHLASEPLVHEIEWSKVIFLFGDERCVAPDDPSSNFLMAKTALLDPVGIASNQVHRLRGEADPESEATRYCQLLAGLLGGTCDDAAGPTRPVDLVLLGLGTNAHTASLFPGLTWSVERHRWVVAEYVEVARSWRLTLGAPVLGTARHIAFLVAGEEKAEAVADVLEGDLEPVVRPAQLFATLPATRWILDAPAASKLSGALLGSQ